MPGGAVSNEEAPRHPAALPALFRVLLVAMLVMAGVAEAGTARETVHDPDTVKAVFLYHFCTFVLWPAEVFGDGPFSIAVLGGSAVAAGLEEFLPGRRLHGRPVRVRRLTSLDELADDAVLYIGQEHDSDLPRLMRRIRGRRMLVVTDAPGGLDHGAVINFRMVNRRVRFEVSLGAAQRAGLELSSRLLSAAMRVDTTSAIRGPAGVPAAKRGWPRPPTRPASERNAKGCFG